MIDDFFEEDFNGDTCPSCGRLLGIESPTLNCEDPDGCGMLKEETEEGLEELSFEEE